MDSLADAMIRDPCAPRSLALAAPEGPAATGPAVPDPALPWILRTLPERRRRV